MTDMYDLFDDLRRYQRELDEKIEDKLEEIENHSSGLEKNLRFDLCKCSDGSLDHNCVYQTLMIKRGFVMDNDLTWHNKDDYDYRLEATYDKSTDLCLTKSQGIDYCHVHVQCNEDEVNQEVERFLN